jgi:hypothetical protein
MHRLPALPVDGSEHIETSRAQIASKFASAAAC